MVGLFNPTNLVMKIFKILFLFLLSFSYSVFAKNSEFVSKSIEDIEEYSTMLDLNGTPSSIVGGCVNVITGHYFEAHEDLSTVGPNCARLFRNFSSGNKNSDDLYDLWQLNLSGKIDVIKDEYTEKISAVVFDRGSPIPFKGLEKNRYLHLDEKILDAGFVNVCSPYASGRMHLINKRLQVQDNGKYRLKTPGVETLYFEPMGEENTILLKSIRKSNGCQLRYNYTGKHTMKIASISVCDAKGSRFGNLWIGGVKDRKVIVESDEGRMVTYIVEKQSSRNRDDKKKHRYCLTSVERNFGPTTKYQYKNTGKYNRELLIRREEPDNRYLNIDYNKHRRVDALYAPVGVDAKPILIWKFKYFPNLRKADVIDAYENKKTYIWAGTRLKRIEEFLSNGELYRKEELHWGPKNTGLDSTLLKAKAVIDGFGKIVFAKTYSYTSGGNITEECFVGNLSGTSTIAPEIDSEGKLIANGCETYVKKYKYNSDRFVVYENDGDQVIDYTYYPNTSLIKLKTISDASGIRQRFYYEYDSNAALTLECFDDGKSSDFNNLFGVSERRIKKTQNNDKGLPEIIFEFYLDLSTNQEILISKIVSTFSSFGFVERIDAYDSENRFAYTQSWIYDRAGNVIEETDVMGIKTFYTYDANGNCILKQTAAASYHKTYDFSNRVIKEEVHADGDVLIKTYAYDLKGHKIRATDIYGNETRFVYDAFGRVQTKILPAIPDLDGNLFYPEESFVYNVLNQPIQKTDANGFVTKKELNAYGKPSLVINPQGSAEKVIYNFNGTVKEMINTVGIRTVFQYDFLKRKIREEKISPQGESLSVQKWIYNTFHLLQEIDPEDIVTDYIYDGAGRLISEKKGEKKTAYIYDTLGRQKEKREFFSEQEYRTSIIEYDPLNRIIEERIENNAGELFSKKQFGYDCAGNRTHETLFTSSGPRTTITRYNGFKLPIKIIAPDNTETVYRYCYDYRNEWNQIVPYQEIIDPLGNIYISVKNTHDGICLEERKNIFGCTAQKFQLVYDATSHPLRRIEQVVVLGKVENTHTTAFQYDSMGREIAIFEGFREPEQKISRRDYNALGDISHIYKPDGVVLEHSYDALGRLSTLVSSDHSIDYLYTYDRNHNIIQVEDRIDHSTTKRVYDTSGLMRSETLDHGLKIDYDYDKMGRLQELTLPDLSNIRYIYNSPYAHLTFSKNLFNSKKAV